MTMVEGEVSNNFLVMRLVRASGKYNDNEAIGDNDNDVLGEECLEWGKGDKWLLRMMIGIGPILLVTIDIDNISGGCGEQWNCPERGGGAWCHSLPQARGWVFALVKLNFVENKNPFGSLQSVIAGY